MFIVVNKSYGPYVSAICDDMDSAQHELKREIAALRRIAGEHWTPSAGANVVIVESSEMPAQLYRCRMEGDRNGRNVATVPEGDAGRPSLRALADALPARLRNAVNNRRVAWWSHKHLDGNAAQLQSWTLEIRDAKDKTTIARIVCEGYRYVAALEIAA